MPKPKVVSGFPSITTVEGGTDPDPPESLEPVEVADIPGETKREKSLRIAEGRGDRLLKAIALFQNLAGSNYEFDPEFIGEVLSIIKDRVNSMVDAFQENAVEDRFHKLFHKSLPPEQ